MIVHETHFYVDALGNLLGGFGDGAMPSDPNAVRVMTAPNHGNDTWDGAGWVTTPPTAAEVREFRNAALAATDFMGLSDYPAKAGELEYRQALRDVPQQAGFPNAHTWPNKP
jgi:hypothetical protein